jgi:hypothetical protein
MIFLLFASLINFYANATVLPAAYILRLHQNIMSRSKTVKIEQRVVYEGQAFNETILFKAPDKLRVYVEKEGDAVLFIRDKNNCIAISSNARVDYEGLCSKNIASNFYYSAILPISSLSRFLKASGIKTNYKHYEIERDGIEQDLSNSVNNENFFNAYNNSNLNIDTDAETNADISKYPVLLLRYQNKPIYVLGLSDSEYNRALSSVKRDKLNLTDSLLEAVKDKAKQVWFETLENKLLRIFGKDSVSKKTFELNFINYKKDSNNNYMPELIDLKIDEKSALSYGLKNFETNGTYADEIFSVKDYKTKFVKTLGTEELSDNKKILFNYLKEYR